MAKASDFIIEQKLTGLDEVRDALENRLAPRRVKVLMRKSIVRGLRPLVNITRSKAPRKSRLLRRSITSVVRQYKDGVFGLVGQHKRKAFKATKRRRKFRTFGGRNEAVPIWLVDQSTQAHEINARNAPNLVFQVGGRWVRAKSVNHPGTTGKQFVEAAGRQGAPHAVRAFEKKFGLELDRELAKRGK